MTIGNLLRTVREREGLTQLQVAQRLGASQQAVAKFESDASSMRVGTLERYAEALCMNLKIGFEKKKTKSPSTTFNLIDDLIGADV